MKYVAICLLTIAAVELLFRLPSAVLIQRLVSTVQKAQRVVLSRSISDHWKEKVLPRYSLSLAGASLQLGGLLAFFSALVALLSFVLDAVFSVDRPTVMTLMTWTGLIVSLLVSIAYGVVRGKIVKH